MHLDTHVVLWLYAGEVDRFTEAGKRLLNTTPVEISPIVRLELTFLHEIGRLIPEPRAVLNDLNARIGLREIPLNFATVVDQSESLAWTRDPFDRLICASAAQTGSSLLTRDRLIREHFDLAFW
jgi:PIN domain nuclease of toxin-antitoxin system